MLASAQQWKLEIRNRTSGSVEEDAVVERLGFRARKSIEGAESIGIEETG